MLCPFKNCSTSSELHDFDATTCKLNLTGSCKETDDHEELDYFNLSEKAKKDLQDIQSSYFLLVDSMLKKINSGAQALEQNQETQINKAKRFYLEWKAAEEREKLKNNPKLIITSLMNFFPNTELHKRFQIALLLFPEFEVESLYNILCAFLNDEYPDDLLSFDIYIRGCLNAYRRSQSSIQKTSQDLQEPMRSSGDKISEGSFKTVAKSKHSDIERIENMTTAAQASEPDENSTIVKFKGFLCAPVYFIIKENGRLDGINTFRVNDDLEIKDAMFLRVLEYACPTSLSLMSQLTWRELISLERVYHSTDQGKENYLWQAYISKKFGHKVRSPEIITAITTTAELRGFICEPVSLILDETNYIDVYKTLKVNNNISISDASILNCVRDLGKRVAEVSQLSWKEVGELYRTFSTTYEFADNTPKFPEMISVTFTRLINN